MHRRPGSRPPPLLRGRGARSASRAPPPRRASAIRSRWQRARRTEAPILADLITRPDARPDTPIVFDTMMGREETLAEQLLTTQSPQRPQSTPAIRIEVDGRVVEGLEGQKILVVCRGNGHET